MSGKNQNTQNKKLAFFSFVVCVFSLILLLLSLLEYEMLHSLFQCSEIERDYYSKMEKGELLENILYVEKNKMEAFLRKFPEKSMFDYFNRQENGSFLQKKGEEFLSHGGYFLEKDFQEIGKRDFYKVYYVKYYRIAEYQKKYKVMVLIEYQYGTNREVQSFVSKKLIEMRIFLE